MEMTPRDEREARDGAAASRARRRASSIFACVTTAPTR